MGIAIQIGWIIEPESRDITQCPGYYAADTETLRTRPGRYPLRVAFEGGYLIPMPYWLLAGIDADRIAGRTYNGFGGHNFSSQELPKEPKRYVLQTYVSSLQKFVEEGKAEVFPEYAGLVADHKAQIEWASDITWAKLAEIKAQQEVAAA